MKFKQIRIPSKDLRKVLDYIKREDASHKIIYTNLLTNDHERELRQSLNLRPDVEYGLEHWVLAFPEQDLPHFSEEKIRAIWKRFNEEMGLKPVNKFVAASHRSDKQHSHELVSRVGSDGSLWNDSFCVRRGIQIAAKLEKEFGLTRTKTLASHREGPELSRRISLTKHEFEEKTRTGLPVRKEEARLIIEEALAHSTGDFDTFSELCAKRGLSAHVVVRTNGSKGITFSYESVSYKGSAIGRGYSYAGINRALQTIREKGLDLAAPAIPSPRQELEHLRDVAAAKNELAKDAREAEKKEAEFEKRSILERLANLMAECPKELEFEITMLYHLVSWKLYKMNFYWYLKKHVSRLETETATLKKSLNLLRKSLIVVR